MGGSQNAYGSGSSDPMCLASDGGHHMCLGLRFAEMQVKAVLFQLLARYRFSVPDGYRMPVQQAPISKPTDGLPLTLEAI